MSCIPIDSLGPVRFHRHLMGLWYLSDHDPGSGAALQPSCFVRRHSGDIYWLALVSFIKMLGYQ